MSFEGFGPFERLRLEHQRTLFVFHGWRELDGTRGSNYSKLANSLSEAIADLEANECSVDVGGYVVRDAFVVKSDDGEPEIHVELVGPDELLDLGADDA